MQRLGPHARNVLLLVVVVAVAVPVIVVGAMALRSRAAPPPAPSPELVATQECASCLAAGTPNPLTPGETVLEDGVQVLHVGLVGGYYEPNDFTVEAGVPVRVVFTGRAAGCLAEPEFPELGVKGDMASGVATVDLGSLEPGSYEFTCSMGVNEGRVTAR